MASGATIQSHEPGLDFAPQPEESRARTPTRWQSVTGTIFSIDLRSLAALRIGLGILLLLDLADRTGDLTAHYSDGGALPRSLVIDRVLESGWLISIHFLSGVAPVQAALFALAAVCAFCLLLGYRTRLATTASWFLLLSLHNRNPMILQGGDTLLRMLLFWGMFLPLGTRFSMDAAVRGSHVLAPRTVLSVATAAILLQVAFVYWFSVLLKTDPVWFGDYSAVYVALSLDHFVTPLGKLLLPYASLLRALTFGTLWLEMLGPLAALAAGLLWWPARVVVILAFFAFHIGMGLCLELGLFSCICCVAWLVFIPGQFWDWLGKKRVISESKASVRLWPLFRRIRGKFNAPPAGIAGHVTTLGASWHSQFLAGFFLLYILLWNLRTTHLPRFASILPHTLNPIGWVTGVCQIWDMFSPSPLREDGWFIMPALLMDGTEVDVFRGGNPVDWEKPSVVSAMYKNDRWRKYMVLLAAAANTDRRLPYARYLCRQWNANHPPEQHIRTLRIYLMQEDTLPDYRVSTPRPVLLWTQECTGQGAP